MRCNNTHLALQSAARISPEFCQRKPQDAEQQHHREANEQRAEVCLYVVAQKRVEQTPTTTEGGAGGRSAG